MLFEKMCDRCQYNEASAVPIPEYFADSYQAICEDCANDLQEKQAKMADWSPY